MMQLSGSAEAAGFQLQHLARVESTNSLALSAVGQGADRRWIVADEQSAGRGRHGRAWHSPPGNLYASLGLFAPCAAPFGPLMGFVAGLSLVEAIIELAPGLDHAIRLKWPNDCLVAGAKVAGILLEGTSLPGGAAGLAIGIGVNVAHRPAALERRVTALIDHAPSVTAAALFGALSARMAANLALFDRGAGFGLIRSRWLDFALPLGTAIVVRPPSGERRGEFAGIDAGGHLLIRTPAGIETIMVGDVILSEPIAAAGSPDQAFDPMRITG